MISKIKFFGLASLVGVGFYLGTLQGKAAVADIERDLAQQQAEAASAIAESSRLNAANSDLIAKLDAVRSQKQKTVTKEIEKEVIRYVESPDAGKCDLDYDWVRYNDAAATNTMPTVSDPTAQPNAGATGITEADALVVITDNYLMCNEVREQLILLQKWVESIKQQ